MTTLHGQEDMTPDTLAAAPRIPPPHKLLLPGHHQQTNTHPCTINPADFVEPIQHTLVNSVTNTSALTVTSMHRNIYLTIVNDNWGSPDILHRSRKNQDPQDPSTGTMRATMRSKAMKMEISMEKIDHLTHMAPNLFLSLTRFDSPSIYLILPHCFPFKQTSPFSSISASPLWISTAHHLLQKILFPQRRPLHLCQQHYVSSSSLSSGLQLGSHPLQTRNHGIWPQEFRIHGKHSNQPSPPPKWIHQPLYIPSPSIYHLQPTIQHLRRLHQARLVRYPLHRNILGISGNWTTIDASDRTHWWSIWYPTKQCSDPQEAPITNQHWNHLFYRRRRQLWWHICWWKSHGYNHVPLWRHSGV